MNRLAVSPETLINRIYEAAVMPGAWVSVLDSVADQVGAAGTFMFLLADKGNQAALWSNQIDGLCRGWIDGGWQARTQRAPRMLAFNHSGFVADCDVYGPGELEHDDAYVNYLRPSGFGNGAGTNVTMPSGDIAIFSVERYLKTSPFTRNDCVHLDQFRPHLARAALCSMQLGLERYRTVTDLLQSMKIPAAVVRTNGRLLIGNSHFDKLQPLLFQDRSDRLRLVQKAGDELLKRSLEQISRRDEGEATASIPLVSTDLHPPMIAHVLPIRRSALDVFTGASAIILVTPIIRSEAPSSNMLQGLFDLTPAEARVAQAVVAAQSIDGIASAWNVKAETVRTQIKSVFAKTGTRKQSELVSLLAGKAI